MLAASWGSKKAVKHTHNSPEKKTKQLAEKQKTLSYAHEMPGGGLN